MADFELSNYQKNIMQYVSRGISNLLVDAKAGSGKTSTLLLIANELTRSGKKCLFLAFNKSIVEELSSKIDDTENCQVKTVHSLGYTFIKSYLYKNYGKDYILNVDSSKLRNLVKEYYDTKMKSSLDMYNLTGVVGATDDFITSDMIGEPMLNEKELKDLHNKIVTDFVNLCNFCRLYNVNYKSDSYGMFKLVEKFCWYLKPYVVNKVYENYMELVIAVIDKIKEMFEHPEKSLDGKVKVDIDYTDMIYFPVYYNMQVPYSLKDYLDTVLVDECQDLSILQQKFIRKLDTRFNKFIFVGDEKQSIYGFAGADVHAIEKLNDTFVLTTLPLNICYRCPENVIKLAQELVPDIEWNKARSDKGNVEFVTMEETINNIKQDDVLIGRKNKDLVKIYRKFVLQLKKPVKFRNQELVNSLVNNIEVVITEYVKRYVQGTNIEVPLYSHMADWIKTTGENKESELYANELQNYSKILVSENSGMSKRRQKGETDIDFLTESMKEYKSAGAYGREEDDQLTEFYDVIQDFITEYKGTKPKSKYVKELLKYIREFLSGSKLKDKVPVISSVHSMKGGEADTVYIFDFPLFPYQMGKNMSDDDFQQEKNLLYVAITRAKKNLYLVECDEGDFNRGDYYAGKNAEARSRVKALLSD